MPVHITALSQTDPGMLRERNEDSAFVLVPSGPHDDMALLIVADGMGGYRAGDKASALAVETIRSELEPLFGPSSAQPTIKLKPKSSEVGERTTVELPETASSEHYGGFLTQAIRRANEVIVEYGQKHRESRGLGSTVTMAIVARNRVYFANVGDSRSYLFREGVLRPITRDHSLVARLVEDGEIEPDDIYSHPKRNLIYRSLGAGNEEVEVDLFEEDLFPGDVLLLCSDGLWEKVRADAIISILQNDTDLAAMAGHLITSANENGGEDNITLILARCVENDETHTSIPGDLAEADTGEVETLPADQPPA